MQLVTSRFGAVEIQPDDILLFPAGLAGFEDCLHWALLADAETDAVAWLQSVVRAELSLPVVSPRRFVESYQLRVSRAELLPMQFSAYDQAYVLAIVSKHDDALTVNLKAPLVINLDRRIGRQVVASDEQSLQFPLAHVPAELRKSA